MNSTLTPVIDRASGKGFFASIPAASAGSTPRILMLTGTTHSLDSSVRDRLNARFNTGAIRYNPYIFLDVGGKPESPFIGLLATLVCGTIAALFLATSLLQHTIFQRTRETKTPQNVAANSSFSSSSATMSATMMDATSSTRLAKESALCAPRISGEIGDLRITGKLRLHEKAAQRFTDMPASRLHLEDGSYAFASNIDASTRTYGVVTTKRVGLWLLMPNLRTVQWEEGNLYNGFRPRPALRLKFEDALDKNRRSTAISSFADDASRAQLIAELQQETARALAA